MIHEHGAAYYGHWDADPGAPYRWWCHCTKVNIKVVVLDFCWCSHALSKETGILVRTSTVELCPQVLYLRALIEDEHMEADTSR